MSRASRKLEHLRLALKLEKNSGQGFSDVHFVHQALPDSSLAKVSLTTFFGGLTLSSPIIINALTGGAFATQKINEQLAIVARETGLAIAVGSQMAAVKNKELIKTFQIVRKTNKSGLVFANIGSEASVQDALEAIEMIEADALQVHLNVIQELIMPEGERDFSGALDRLETIKEAIKIPLIIKEVGFGISQEVAGKLKKRGITLIDVGGKGGTNFANIENSRRTRPLNFFADWGINTPESILEVGSVGQMEIIASGGLRDGLDIAKAIGLGASAVGIAGSVLDSLVRNKIPGTISYLEDLQEDLRIIMTALGAGELKELPKKPMVILNNLLTWCLQRGISLEKIKTH